MVPVQLTSSSEVNVKFVPLGAQFEADAAEDPARALQLWQVLLDDDEVGTLATQVLHP